MEKTDQKDSLGFDGFDKKVVQDVLERAQIPGRHYLRVATSLRDAMKRHDDDRASWRETMGKVSEYFKQHHADRDSHLQEMEAMRRQHADEIRALKESHEKVLADSAAEVERIKKIKQGKPGEPGRDVDHELIIRTLLGRDLLPKGQKGDPGDDAEFDKEELFKEFTTRIIKGKLIKAEHVQGMSGWVRDGVKYRFEELMHGGGTSKTYTANTSGTGTITGAVNGSNTTFTLPAGVPSNAKVFADGARQVSPGDYTRSGNSLVFVVAPISNVVVDG